MLRDGNQPGRRGASSVGPPYHGRLGIYLPKMLAAASAEESFPSVTPFTIEPDFPELGKRELQIYARLLFVIQSRAQSILHLNR